MTLVKVPVMQVRVKNAKLSAKALSLIGLESEKVIRASFKNATKKIADKMNVAGKPPTYPIQWDSPKQRRAFFATNGFGGGIPHVRTGAYIAAWEQKTIRGGYQVANMKRYAGYIAGDIMGKRQSRIHRGRWPVFRKVVDRILKTLPNEIVSDLKTAYKKIGFRVKNG